MFVTNVAWKGDLHGVFANETGLDGADSKCTTEANGSSLGGTWKAFLSSGSVQAIDRVADSSYYLVDGTTMVAASKAALKNGDLVHAIDRDAANTAPSSGTRVWVGSLFNGNGLNDTCGSWLSESADEMGTVGDFSRANDWANWQSIECNTIAHIYCFEQ